MFSWVQSNKIRTSERLRINPKNLEPLCPAHVWYLCIPLQAFIGTIAQVVEQWTENPCVPGSNPGGTTLDKRTANSSLVLFLAPFDHDLS